MRYWLLKKYIEKKEPLALVTVVDTSAQTQKLLGSKWLVTERECHGLIDKCPSVLQEKVMSLGQQSLDNKSIISYVMEQDVVKITLLAEPIIPEPQLIIFGAGHIARPLAQLAHLIKMNCVVYDDRPDLANPVHFPHAQKVICDSFANVNKHELIFAHSNVVVATRGHKQDYTCLTYILSEPFAYLGMVSSKKRAIQVKEKLAVAGLAEEKINSIHSPIGLDIGANTPEEIAVSIIAEIIQKQNVKIDAGAYTVIKELSQLDNNAIGKKPVALATIVKTIGSTPRKTGANMLINSMGEIVGTIGGGCAEAQVKLAALDVITANEPQLIYVNMNNDVAEDEGMMCGGKMIVLIEPATGVNVHE